MRRITAGIVFVIVTFLALWSNAEIPKTGPRWQEIAPGMFRSDTSPAMVALVKGEHALVIDAVLPPSALASLGVKKVDQALLTHHHRDTVEHVGDYLADKVPVRAAKESAEWLMTANVTKFWQDSIPLRSSRTAYFVVPTGFDGIDCTLADGAQIEWQGWKIDVVATPGHSRDHLAYLVSDGQQIKVLCCGDAFSTPGKLWTPYTSDWDHWTDMGLKPTSESLTKMAALKPKMLVPAQGPIIATDVVATLEATAKAVGENAFLRSYQRYTEKLGDVPAYKFLVPKEQVASAGEKPWSQVSEHIFITGNTYVLVSKQHNAFLVIDPWAERSVKQIAKLKEDQKLGTLEVVWFSHAHYDHFDGLYSMAGRDGFQVWALDEVALPLEQPLLRRAPFLDVRPIRFEKKFKDGDSIKWREYDFKFHHLPGQTYYTMGVESTIDGKKCLFSADNFFHHEQFSGTGGWMGLNRSSPVGYASSARKVLELAPEWMLAEHGGPFEFSAEDFKRRSAWGDTAAKAADAISPSDAHLQDWSPYRFHVEPLLQKATAGATVKFKWFIGNATPKPIGHRVELRGRGLFPDQKWEVEVAPKTPKEQAVEFVLPANVSKGRHIFALTLEGDGRREWIDTFIAVDVE